MLFDYFALAFKNIKHRGVRSWLTILGIFIGIAAVVALISLGAGLKDAVTGQFSTLDTDKLIIQNSGTGFGPPGSTVVRKLDEHDVKVIESVSGVKQTLTRLIRMVKVEYNKVAKFQYVVSVHNDREKIQMISDSMNLEMAEGRFLEASDKNKVVLGNDFTDDSFEKPIRVGSNLEIQGENFEVVGILKKGSSFQTNSVVFMMEDDLKRILNIGDEFDIIVAQVYENSNIEYVAKNLERKLRSDRGLKAGEEDFSVQTPLQGVETINLTLNIINLILSGIAGISLFVGGIGIANTMYTSVLERTKEIGVMKAIGAQNKDILLIFLIESGLLGLVGGVIGASLGLGLSYGVSYIVGNFIGIEMRVLISYPLLLGAVSFSFVVGILSGILPAIQASKLNVVEALRR